jgi:NADH-quinone oxidoreductase subunit I
MKEYFLNVWKGFWTTIVGITITLPRMFRKSVTLQYPDEVYKLPERSRMRLDLIYDDCIGCNQCANICPVDCITVGTTKAPQGQDYGKTSEKSGAKIKRLRVDRFDIDMSLCCYCGLCTEVCPTECLVMTPNYEFSVFDTKDFVYKFADAHFKGTSPSPDLPKKTYRKKEPKVVESYRLWKDPS